MATPSPPELYLAYALRLVRVKAGMTQEELALKVEMAPSEISRLERGKRKPHYNTMKRVAKGLKIHCWQWVWLAEQLEAGVLADDLDWPLPG